MVQSGGGVHDSEDAIVSEIRILHQLSEWKYVVSLKALSIDSSGLLYVRDWLVLLLISWYFNYSDVA